MDARYPAAMADGKLAILSSLRFGHRVAEEEVDDLASYFVETNQWKKLLDGEVDIVFGRKGSGKSAMYATLLQRDDDLFTQGIVLVSAENPRGTPAFKDLASDPPTSEVEFVSLWKLYTLSLIGSVLVDYGISDGPAKTVRAALISEGLLPPKEAPLRTRLRSVIDWVRRAISLEGAIALDPATILPSGVGGKIMHGRALGC